MFIRKTKVKKSSNGGDGYFTFRIVESERIGNKVRQRTLLNLGKHFSIPSDHWPLLVSRIKHILSGQKDLLDDELNIDPEIEKAAHQYSAAILQQNSISNDDQPIATQPDYQSVNVNDIEVSQPRSIGLENVLYHTIEQLEIIKVLMQLGFNSKDIAAAIGNIVGRLVAPDSERSTLSWLQSETALGELIGHDYQTTSLTRLYQVTDKLFKHREAIETHLAHKETELFNLERRVILYDLTNTYFEGEAKQNPKAKFGRSKEKRSDCKLVTMGLVLDADGFPLNSRIFEGNISEPKTLERMVNSLVKPVNQSNPIIVMDAGIASEENIGWLKTNNYRYIVVSRERYKQRPDIESSDSIIVKDSPGNQVVVQKVVTQSDEVRVYCHSQGKEKKEQSMSAKFSSRFEEGLTQLNDGLHKKGCTKKYEKVMERLGRLKEKNPRVANEYKIDIIADDNKLYATEIKWKRNQINNEKLGVYCLRSSIMDWEADSLWKTYTMLTEVEATFKSLKTDFGLRPVYHQKEDRVSAHLFISLIAYHVAHSIRYQLKNKNIHLNWKSIRKIMSTQQRVTIALPTEDNEVVYVRTTSKAETTQAQLCSALGISTDRLGKKKTNIRKNKICSANSTKFEN